MHKALQTYYEAIVPLLDSYAEAYQGRYGLMKGYRIGAPINQNPLKAPAYFRRLLALVKKTRVRDSYLKNIRDEIYSLVYQTLYMLMLNK
jgi:hypothetical protein